MKSHVWKLGTKTGVATRNFKVGLCGGTWYGGRTLIFAVDIVLRYKHPNKIIRIR
jgi:hypothetical protein